MSGFGGFGCCWFWGEVEFDNTNEELQSAAQQAAEVECFSCIPFMV